MKAEFEEKDFEAPLYNELRFGSHRIATPGQVFEGKFGIDAAIEAEHPLFWDLFGYYDVPKGVVLNDLRWGFVWRRLGYKRRLPNFSTNLLLQAKRPEVMKRVSTLLKPYGFSKRYWKYQITPHQQNILEKVSRNLRNRALVVYAAPAFDTLDELYEYTEAQVVVENSNFIKVERLKDHEKWNYKEPGTSGVALSEPEFIEDMSFSEILSLYREINQDNDNHEENLAYLHRSILEICEEMKETNPIARYYLRIHARLMRMDSIFDYESSIDYIAFNLFCNIVKLKWLVI